MTNRFRWTAIVLFMCAGCLAAGLWLRWSRNALADRIRERLVGQGAAGQSYPNGRGDFYATLDRVWFGDPESERNHAVEADEAASQIVTGERDESARVLLPPADGGWLSGSLCFTLKVDPERVNQVTARFWGGETNENLLFLFCEGKQIGYRPLGDYDVLCYGSTEPPAHGRYLYMSTPLPLALTQGKRSVNLEIRATGRIWPYGTTFDQYQRPMDKRSRLIYEVATHTDPSWVPLTESIDKRKVPEPVTRPLAKGETEELMRAVTDRIVDQGRRLMARPGEKWTQMEAQFMARLSLKPWGGITNHTAFLNAFVACVDTYTRRQQADPKLVTHEPSTWNPEWFGFGPLGDAVRILYPDLESRLAESVEWEGGRKLTRREAWTAIFAASLYHLRTHRRSYTNQSMIIDLNLYRSNRALSLLDRKQALSEFNALEYLHESFGIRPWLGPDNPDGKRTAPLGTGYRILSENGLSRELGYVGNYGEMLDWMAEIYQATMPVGRISVNGSAQLKSRLIQAALARAPFRYPATDSDGYRAMRIETVVGWRDLKLIDSIAYGPRFGRDGSSLRIAALTKDPKLMGYAQQELADHQFQATLRKRLEEKGLRDTIGLMDLPDDYAAIAGKPEILFRLPMTAEERDFCFFDLDDGVIALKRGDMILYVSLYWRARYGINRLAKIHQITPKYEYRATVPCEAFFEPDARTYRRPKTTDEGYGCPPFKEYDVLVSAHAGEELPIAKIPTDAEASFKVGQWNVYAGSADGYRLDYGKRIFVMNRKALSGDRSANTMEIRLPPGTYRDFASKTLFSGKITVPPRTCYILEAVN
ncbi:MAG: hypothetical protein J6336_03835 [Kiritimatiellae bacterium]|nr:hypothetical protein [Kiritimatiellia bacterium]